MSVKRESSGANGLGSRRRVWPDDQKRRIVAETFEPGASVSVVARRHDLNANMLFTWRRTIGGAKLAPVDGGMALVPAVISPEPVRPITSPPPSPIISRMEIALASGDRVIVDSTVDAGALARVIKVLSRR
jgi:transposase